MPIRSKGCDLCKRRRVKCDLNRPGCLKCSRYGVACPGYSIPVEGVTQIVVYQAEVTRSRIAQSPLPGSTSASARVRPTPLKKPGYLLDISETLQHVNYCWNNVEPAVFGSHVGQDWKKTVFQLSSERAILQNLLAAIGCSHIAFSTAATATDDGYAEACRYRSLVLQYAHLSISDLLRAFDQQDTAFDLVLSSTLFATLELYGTHCAEAHEHMRQTIIIYRGSCYTDLEHSVLRRFFGRFEEPSTLHWNADSATAGEKEVKYTSSGLLPNGSIANPSAFTSVEEARNNLDSLIAQIHNTLLEHSKADDGSRTSAIRRQLLNWISELDTSELLTSHLSRLCHEDLVEVSALRLRARQMAITASAALSRDEMIFDEYTADFKKLLSECELYVDGIATLDRDNNAHAPFGTSFAMDPQLQPSLWLVAARCRVHWIRHRAIELLLKARRREAEWSSVFTALVLGKIIAIEEEQCSDMGNIDLIPARARIRAVEVNYNPGIEYFARTASFRPTVTIKYLRWPFTSGKARLEKRTFKISEDELAETESLRLSCHGHPERLAMLERRLEWIGSMNKRKQGRWTKWLLSSGRYDAPWTIKLDYSFDSCFTMLMPGVISYEDPLSGVK